MQIHIKAASAVTKGAASRLDNPFALRKRSEMEWMRARMHGSDGAAVRARADAQHSYSDCTPCLVADGKISHGGRRQTSFF